MATINVDEATKETLKKYCKRHEITQGDFVKFALDYFLKAGIDPASPPLSIKEELSKMEKRVSQVIAFQKTFERDNLVPLIRDLRQTSEKVSQYAQLSEKITRLSEEVVNLSTRLVSTQNNLANHNTKLKGETSQELATIQAQLKRLDGQVQDVVTFGASYGGMIPNSIKDKAAKSK